MLGTTPYLSRKSVKVIGPDNPGFEIVNMALNAENFLYYRGADAEIVLEPWESIVPRGVALGRQLYRSGELRRMKEASSKGGSRNAPTTEEVLDWLWGMV